MSELNRFRIGIDVGSTTVKAVIMDAASNAVVWKDYRRHETRQNEMVLEFLQRMEREAGVSSANSRIFVTGTGGGALAEFMGAHFVQEVLAASLAVERRFPEAGCIVEIGGQDAKIVVLKKEPGSRRPKKIPSMNDKCAGGTGAVIDKISAKLGVRGEALARVRYRGTRLHQVAGKCGVFAETDINGLQKQGIPAEELMASLFEAFALQNLKVLARGHTLMPHAILLGGPNAFIPAMREAFQSNIAQIWQERDIAIPDGARVEDLAYAPPDAEYYGAIGAAEYGIEEEESIGQYQGTANLEAYLSVGRYAGRESRGMPGLVASREEAEGFMREFAPPRFVPPVFVPGSVVRGYIGLDAGSTSTKAVLLSEEKEVLAKAYQLSRGNPIQDMIEILGKLQHQVECQGARIEVQGAVTTGYAKDILRDVMRADAALVETVAHSKSALYYYGQPDAICDVGGQDIKLIVLKEGRVKDFKLNTQCSAGNGYFLQAIAEGFGYRVEQFADVAFSARSMPVFPYGCAIFLQADIVSFQGQGWKPNEIMAGLAAVLPKNVWLYVAKMPNLADLGTRFILQGGTQNNLAAVKAQVDFIRERFRGTGLTPEITVHRHSGEAGAIGAAMEAMDLHRQGRQTTFIGLDAVATIQYKTTAGEETRCVFCKNHCVRTFIDLHSPGEGVDDRRVIIAACEKGSAVDVEEMRSIQAGIHAAQEATPNLVEYASRQVWKAHAERRVADPLPHWAMAPLLRQRRARMLTRAHLRIGIPRVLAMYAYAPFFNGYFESLGVQPGNLVYSDFTNDEMYRAGVKRGAIDPCFPSKLGLAHVHNLIFVKHRARKLDCLFFPMFDLLRSPLEKVRGKNACPTTALTPEIVKAAFTKETDIFSEQGIVFLTPLLDMSHPDLLARQLLSAWKDILGLSEGENRRAVAVGFETLDRYENDLRRRGREILERIEGNGGVGVLVLGRVYHHDPAVHNGILDALQKRGYPILSQNTLPLDEDLLRRMFGDDLEGGIVESPMEIQDVWANSFSASSSLKLWAAKFAARHPNLIALELSSFKCGHDATIYTTVEKIIEQSHTPYFAFKDIDENKPAGSIKLRVETIDYFLNLYRRQLSARRR